MTKMAVDNPTYFSVAAPGCSSGAVPASASSSSSSTSSSSSSSPSHARSLTSFLRRKVDKMGSNSSASVTSASTTSTITNFESDKASCASSTPAEERVGLLGGSRNGCATANQSGNSQQGNGAPSAQRRSFRNLFRSVSANTDPEKTQQILNGDPRPSDVAPPSPYLPHRSHSHSENDRRRPGRKKIPKSASELLSNDMVYCGLPGEEPTTAGLSVVDGNDPEVFLGVDDARYYNISATLPIPGSAAAGRRRHSIGTFFNKTNNNNQSTKKISNEHIQQPDTMAPPIPTTSQDRTNETETTKEAKPSRRRRHRSASSKGTRIAPNSSNVAAESAADDVVLISTKTEGSLLWVNYLMSNIAHIRKQHGRTPFKVRHVTIEESMTSEVEENIGAAHLRIIVVCSVLLEYVESNQTKAATLSKQLASGKVFAMMLGVDDTHVTESHRKTLLSYPQWKKFVVKDNDADFVNEVMTEAFNVIGSSTAQVTSMDQTSFSVLPKKVKMGQSRVIALLNDPLDPDDAVTVVVDKCGEAIDISHVKKRNPYTLQFSIPDRCLEVSMLVGVRISKNGEALGMRQVKCESRLRELDQILRANNNPLEFMCQTLGFNTVDREQLDNWMVHAFQRNLPPHFKLLSPPPGTMSAHRGHTSPEEIPTLLHFAARFGLEKLAWQLLECPGGDEACDLKNVAELTPADLAEQAGHAKLAHVLRGYMQMNEFTNMYTYLKVMSESTSTPTPGNRTPIQDHQDTYSQPRLLTDVYMVPPAARPLPSVPLQPSGITIYSNNTSESPVGDYAIAPAPTPVQVLSQSTNILANSSDLPFQGYMEMHPAVRKTPLTPTLPRAFVTENSARNEIVPEIVVEQSRDESTPTITPTSTARLNGSGKPREQAGPQDELLEIINDFKRNVFTINEVEKLVEDWKNRNDVQQNFKQKQRQLIEMRDEYERIQKMMKDDMKRPTPFDKVRKFFTKGKKDPKDTTHPDETLAANKFDPNTLVNTSNRPVSSLSFQSVSSSSSSGRMSMVSECSGASLGDSGTHSDPDERKRVSTDKDDVSYYGVPPAPRAYPASYSPINGQQRRPPQPPPKPSEADIYYITCPPSGLPIHSFKSNGTAREPETPNSPTAAPVYLDILELAAENQNDYQVNFSNTETLSQPPPGMCIPREYMNHKPVQSSGQRQPLISGGSIRSHSDNSEDPVNEGNVGSASLTEAHYADILPVQDTSDLPEYTNVGIMAQVIKDNNSTTYKKIVPAPPVPPRTKT